jgi:hypothetical protein
MSGVYLNHLLDKYYATLKSLTSSVCKFSTQQSSSLLSSLIISPHSQLSYSSLCSNISTLTTNALSFFQHSQYTSPSQTTSPSVSPNYFPSNPQIPQQPPSFSQSTQKVGMKMKVFFLNIL